MTTTRMCVFSIRRHALDDDDDAAAFNSTKTTAMYLNARASTGRTVERAAEPMRRASAVRANYSCAFAGCRACSARRISFGPVRGRTRSISDGGWALSRESSRSSRVSFSLSLLRFLPRASATQLTLYADPAPRRVYDVR